MVKSALFVEITAYSLLLSEDATGTLQKLFCKDHLLFFSLSKNNNRGNHFGCEQSVIFMDALMKQ